MCFIFICFSGVGDSYLTPVLQTPERILQRCETNGFAGCIHYPVNALQIHEKGLHFYFELYIYNTAGHFTVVKTETFKLPSRFPPGKAIVFDLNPLEKEIQTDVDFHGAIQQACVYWDGFYHHHNVTFYVGIGHKPNRDDVVQFAKVDKNPVCINSTALISNKKYFTSVKAESSGGNTISSSDGFMIIDDANGQYSVKVYDGYGCWDNNEPTGTVYPLVKQSHLHGFRISDLVMGLDHTLFVNNSEIDLTNTRFSSTNAISLCKSITNQSITFIPTLSNVELKLDTPLHVSSDVHGYARQCIIDTDFQSSTFQYSVHWHTRGILQQHVTHFVIALDHILCNYSSDDCISEIAYSTIEGTTRNYTLNKLTLKQNSFIRATVQPCFESICLKSTFSNGVHVVHKPSIISLSADILDESSNCTNISVTVDAVCYRRAKPITFQWYLAKQQSGREHITSMITVQTHQSSPVKV